MLFSPTAIAFATLFAVFAVVLLCVWRKLPLWLAILAGAGSLAVFTHIPVQTMLELALRPLVDASFVLLAGILYLILALSGVQAISGQTARLVAMLEERIVSPRLRLAVFPALIGLLPMPGGALISCPMLEQSAQPMGLSQKEKGSINYWFRHIWEISWPLYPGYILTSSLLHLPLSRLATFTFPLVLLSALIGWVFFLPKKALPASTPPAGACTPMRLVLAEALPLLVTLLGAGVFSVVFGVLDLNTPSQLPFLLSLLLGLGIALWQGRQKNSGPLRPIFINANAPRLILLIYGIFYFKDVIEASGIVETIAHIGSNGVALYALFIILPFVCGLLTGIMVGFVGAAFPILIGTLAQAGLQEHAVPLMILALVAGNCGQLLSPLHVCLVVTADYFKTPMHKVWRVLLLPVLVLFLGSVGWILCLHLAGATF